MPSSRAAAPTRHVPWQLGVAALAMGGGVFFLLRAGNDFNQWVITLMWFAVGIYWVLDWRRDAKKRRALRVRASATSDAAPEEAPGAPSSDPGSR